MKNPRLFSLFVIAGSVLLFSPPPAAGGGGPDLGTSSTNTGHDAAGDVEGRTLWFSFNQWLFQQLVNLQLYFAPHAEANINLVHIHHGAHTTTPPSTTTEVITTTTTTTSTTPKPNNTVDPCEITNDLAIAVDESWSVGPGGFNISLEFISELAFAWKKNDATRVSVHFFDTSARVWLDLAASELLSAKGVRDRVLSAKYQSQSVGSGNGTTRTPIHTGLDSAREQFVNHQRDCPRNYVVLTDGQASSLPALQAAAARLHSLPRVRGFAVGVGSTVREQLVAAAGGKEEHVFEVTEFAHLLQTLRSVGQKVCME